MNKTILYVIIGLVVVGGVFYVFNNSDKNKQGDSLSNYKDAEYIIDGKPVKLRDGISEAEAAPGSASKIVTKYFGNEVSTDLNNDGRKDEVFLLTQSTGGSGTFFYVVAALNTKNGWVGSQGYLLGDRIAPQTTELSQNPDHKNVVVVNYVGQADGHAMSDQPSDGKSVWLKFDKESLQFGEVVQNFEGEVDPDAMTLEMKSWTWKKTTYNNDTELAPEDKGAFVLTLKGDGRFSATTDCNMMNGSYEAKDNQITFGNNIAMTRKFCEGSQEQEFSNMLIEAQSYFFTDKGELVFDLKLDRGSSVFR